MNSIRYEKDAANIVHVIFDNPTESANLMNAAFREDFAAQLLQLFHWREKDAKTVLRFAQRQLVREREGLVHDLIGELLHIRVRLHPADLDAASIRHVAEGLRGVECAVHRAVRAGFLVERFAVEFADEIAVLRGEQNPPRLAGLARDG